MNRHSNQTDTHAVMGNRVGTTAIPADPPQAQSSEHAPDFSVVLVAVGGFDIIQRTVEHLRRQTIARRIELLLMSPAPVGLVVPHGVAKSFNCVRVIDIGDERRIGAIRAEGIRVASAPFVAMSEDHCFPNEVWAEMLLERHREGAVVVGPAMANANPGTAQSWASMIIAYSPWVAESADNTSQAWDVRFVAGHNSSYRRDTVLALGEELEELLSSEVILHWRLADRGERIVFEPRACCQHVNVTTLGNLAHAMFHHSRMFGALRTGGVKRLVYLVTTPLVPPLRLWRSWPAVRELTPPGISKARVMATLAPGLVVSAVGEAMGLAGGMGRSPYQDWGVELDRAKLIRAEDRHLVDAATPVGHQRGAVAGVAIVGRPVRIGVIGCGKLVREVHLPLLKPMRGVKLAALADPDHSALDTAVAIAPAAAAHADPADLLADPDIDAVIIAAPTALHAPLAVAAFEAGKHVYLEKPVADKLADADAVLAAQRRAGKLGMIGFNYRQHPGYAAMRRAVTAGEIGRPVHVRSVFTTGGGIMQGAAWRADRAAGGGALLDLFSHAADLVAYVLGQPITEVSARVSSRAGEGDTATVDAVTRTGVRIQGFYAFGTAEQAVLTITGEHGQVSLDRYGGLRLERRGAASPGPVRKTFAALGQWRGIGYLVRKRRSPWGEPSFKLGLSRFVAAVAAGTPTRPSLTDGWSSLAVVAAAEASARSGRPEPVSLLQPELEPVADA